MELSMHEGDRGRPLLGQSVDGAAGGCRACRIADDQCERGRLAFDEGLSVGITQAQYITFQVAPAGVTVAVSVTLAPKMDADGVATNDTVGCEAGIENVCITEVAAK